MTLLLPSSQNVKSFFGEVWNEVFAEKAAAFDKRIESARTVRHIEDVIIILPSTGNLTAQSTELL
jgi:hypothetical protein